MAMRLLQKKDIKTAFDENRLREIEEGQKLAKQIAGIRRTKAEEETSLERFRSETLKQIKTELSPLQKELEEVTKQIEEAKKTRDELLKPLHAEWEEVRKVKKEVEMQLEHATKASKMAQDASNQARAELVKAERTNARLLTLEEVAKDARNSAILLEREARELRESAAFTKETINEHESKVIALIAEEHRKLAVREQTLNINEQGLIVDRAIIEKERIQLADERQTLKRAFNRINNKK